MNKAVHYFLLFLSIIIFLIILGQIDYQNIPPIYSKSSLFYSFLFLFGGFYFHIIAWHKTLTYSQYKVSFSNSLQSIGLTIFGKYIPGKIWMIVGRAVYIATLKKYNVGRLSVLSLNAQFVALWTGLLLGIIGLLVTNNLKSFLIIGILIIFILTALIFTPFFSSFITKTIHKIFRKNFVLTPIYFKKAIALLPWYTTYWILWAIGFYFLICSFVPTHVSPVAALAFPLASTFGIIAIFAPGGLGVREGLLTGYMVFLGFTFQQASVIAVVARLWFLIGEIIIFLVALTAHSLNPKKP